MVVQYLVASLAGEQKPETFTVGNVARVQASLVYVSGLGGISS